MKLKNALRAEEPVYAAVVGAGGKTTALFLLARQLRPPVLVSTSTHFSLEQATLADQHIIITGRHLPEYLKTKLHGRVILISGQVGNAERIQGLSSGQLEELHQLALARGWSLLIEADGSRQLPLKAPAVYEPVIPSWAEMVIVCAGLQVLGKPLDSEHVHRPEIFERLSGASIGKPVSGEHIAALLKHPEGGLKNIPTNAKKVVLLNQVDTSELQMSANNLAETLISPYDAILTASLHNPAIEVRTVHERTAGIILAAGASTRFGQPKILLDWFGVPVLRKEAMVALAAGLNPVIVILGEVIDAALEALHELPVQVVVNKYWKFGQGQSVGSGISALPASTGSVIFLLGDQPQVSVEVLRALSAEHRHGLAAIIAPLVKGQRANPVLFDRVTFQELQKLKGDKGGRALFSHYPVELMPWEDDRLLYDIDTPEDYRKLLENQQDE